MNMLAPFFRMCSNGHKAAKVAGLGTTAGTMTVTTQMSNVVPIPYINELLNKSLTVTQSGLEILCCGSLFILTYLFIYCISTDLAEAICNGYDKYRETMEKGAKDRALQAEIASNAMIKKENERYEDIKAKIMADIKKDFSKPPE